MRLLYDNLIYYLQKNGGISTYWYELTVRFLKEDRVFLNFYEPNQKTANILRQQLPISKEQIIDRANLFTLLDRFVKLPAYNKPHIFHSSYFRTPVKASNTIVVTTVHDFTHEKYYRGPRLWLHKYLKDAAIKASDCIITVSKHTKNDLLNSYPHLQESMVKVIANGASADFQILENGDTDFKNPFFLFVGAREYYKNFDFAVNLTTVCKDFYLYIVGNPLTAKEHQLLKKKLGNRFLVFPNIDKAKLNSLYNTAFCLLYPSSNEGFGIPILEAMQAGCPFIALHASSIPEVAGQAGVLLQALSIEEALCAIDIIGNRRTEIVDKGLEQAKKFSWDNCFKETYSLYRSLAS
ncbi:glycosyltransferase family 1 protein [Pedobacter chinensis]|uniref:Glycosyltransferase family 1 protein n=1 Tax=Pedobacter chinensis TaxID=2282421 RepID=A0A369PNT1_9SPHI|nr:glycosyltransferase family 1 protein [Pedobacter chinensis]RDC54253.1 glycosyltransferase family 1 protein [Pedobacter chinensis]